nr:DNA cytosine methyltransferase [uncultured Sediminibacterium sp.]
MKKNHPENGIINGKLKRIRLGAAPRVLDLFSGCGGLSLGFYKSGFQIVAGVELDSEAIRSHAANFHKDSPHYHEHCIPRDILKVSPSDIFNSIGLQGNAASQIDVIIGGPPCQAFTRIGRAKLRAVTKDSNAFLNDSRSQLYKRYLEYVTELKPVAILMENVPDILNYGGVNIADIVCNDLAAQGYKCRYTLLNTVYYGVPQMRERMFLMAVHKTVDADILFPQPTHFIDLPRGYHGSRNVALKNIVEDKTHKYYMPPPPAPSDSVPAVTAEKALSDLPEITMHLKGKLKRGMKVDNVMRYKTAEGENEFQRMMRTWPISQDQVALNIIRYLPRDYAIFGKMKPGDQYPQAIQAARRILNSKISQAEKITGKKISQKSKQYDKLVAETIPPYDVNKFPNKWRKMEADKPSRTLMAHLGKDSYSHIHYDSRQARTISVREAARLQSFPDGFQFTGAMNAAFRQIGNAVPPLMSEKIAGRMKEILLGG